MAQIAARGGHWNLRIFSLPQGPAELSSVTPFPSPQNPPALPSTPRDTGNCCMFLLQTFDNYFFECANTLTVCTVHTVVISDL